MSLPEFVPILAPGHRPLRWAALLALACSIGCGRGDFQRKVTYGTVTCCGETVAKGKLRFVAIDDSVLPSSSAMIVDGNYRIEQWGGVPIGKYRVEVEARRRTGRQTQDPLSGKTIEETASFGSAIYAGAQSPLIVEVRTDGDGRIDLVIPNPMK